MTEPNTLRCGVCGGRFTGPWEVRLAAYRAHEPYCDVRGRNPATGMTLAELGVHVDGV